MKKIKPFRRTRIRSSMMKVFVISLLLPALTLLMYYSFSNQYNLFKILIGMDQADVSQEYSYAERVNRILNGIVIDDPEIIFNEKELLDRVLPLVDMEEKHEASVLFRRNEGVFYYQELISEDMTDEELKTLSNIMPGFKAGTSLEDEGFGQKANHIILSQLDFYYDNGDKGSIFICYKSSSAAKNIIRRIMGKFFHMFLASLALYSLYAYLVSRSITKPLGNMLIGMKEIEKRNYQYKIDNSKVRNEMGTLIDSFNNMAEKLHESEVQKEKLEDTRNDFINNLSHDLKTPLTSIKMHVEAIKDGVVNTPEKMHAYLSNILKKSDDMKVMLDELKVFSQIETGMEVIKKEKVDFMMFIQDLVDEFSYDLEKIHGKINYSFDNSYDYMINIDLEKMKRAIFNIFENSVKYSSVDLLIVNVNLSKDENHCIVLSIKDNGKGVKQKNLKRLFEKFYREDESRNQNTAGSGIGLAITKAIIESNNGTINARCEGNEGLEIIIILGREDHYGHEESIDN